MAEIPKLDIDLKVEGWDRISRYSRTFPVCGRVAFPDFLLFMKNHARENRSIFEKICNKLGIKFNPKTPIWTAYDKEFISGKELESLPSISVLFKSCFTPYSAVIENMVMNIAYELDIPTSCNFIVNFNKEDYPQITSLYNSTSNMKKLQDVGLVSIDFLQPTHRKEPIISKTTYQYPFSKKIIEIDSIDDIGGDELISFQDAFKVYRPNMDNASGEQNLLENWIYVAVKYIEDNLPNMLKNLNPKLSEKDIEKKVAKTIAKVTNRIARSCVFKEFAGDCDSTDYNGGIVVNRDTGKIRFAPTYDYGECCRALIQEKLKKPDLYCGMSKEVFEKLPENIRNLMIKSYNNKKDRSVESISQDFASGEISSHNLYYAFEHFPLACEELFRNLNMAVQSKKLDNIIEKYNNLTVNGNPLLSTEEVEIFKEYFNRRASWISELYTSYLVENNKPIPQYVKTDIKNLD